MENIINQILEIDLRARQKLEDAYKQKSCILLQAEQDEEKIKNDIIERANNRLCKVEQCEKEDTDAKIEQIKIKTSESIKAIDDIFQTNHIQWENDIYNSIIK